MATEVLRALIADRAFDTDTGGLRLFQAEDTGQDGTFALALVNGPEALDDEVEADGAHVYLEPAVAELLDDKLLDASLESGHVQFVILDAPPADPRRNGVPPEG